MDQRFKDYFLSEDFHKVVSLQEPSELEWSNLKMLAPKLPKGWWELSKLSRLERMELIQQYWENKMEAFPTFCQFIGRFFQEVDDIQIYLIQKTVDHGMEPQLFYSLKSGSFYRGSPPVAEDVDLRLKEFFPDIIFPPDYLSFLQIHSGFCKTTDCTGLTKAENLKDSYDRFQSSFVGDELIFTANQTPINPKKLIPFYTSFGMPFYQCFFADWYPEQEMGNVYVSLQDKRVSNFLQNPSENMSFATFYEWLTFYLEGVDK